MALPEQVVERLSREPVQIAGWSGRLLMFSGTIFFLSLAVYAGLVFGYKPYLDAQVKDLDGQIQRFNQEISVSDQNQLVLFYSQLANLDKVLKNHLAPSPIFEWIESRAQTSVAYAKFNFAPRTGQLSLNGTAKTTDDFVEQLAIFQRDPAVQRINVNSVSVSPNGGWQFDIALFLDPAALASQVVQPEVPAPAPVPVPAPAPSSTPSSTKK